MKSVLQQSICVLITYGCISVPADPPAIERLESLPFQSKTIKDKEVFYFSDKQVINEGNEKSILLIVSKMYENVKVNSYKAKRITKRKIMHKFSEPMVPIFTWWMEGIESQQRQGNLQCGFSLGHSSTAVPCQIFGFFLFVIPTEVVVYASLPIWYPLQYFFHKIRNDETPMADEEKEKPEKINEVVDFDYGSKERNLKIYENSYYNGAEIISIKPVFRDKAIELKLMDLFDVEKNKNTAFRKEYIITFVELDKRRPTSLYFILEQSETGNLEITSSFEK